ncbi:MAG: HAD family phosphatase [Ruminococcaceae bacterium]|nr:HAD family phosphatase [Oscillospiraceae bacterium]
MIKGAIFDMDGTIIDSMFIWDTIAEDYLLSLGIEPKENLGETFKTFTLEQSAEYYRKNYGVTLTVSEIKDGINSMVEDIYRKKVTLKDGAGDFLERLSASGVKMCIATVTDRYIAEKVLSRLGVDKYFSDIFVCSEVGFNKESPEIYRYALKHLGTKKEETVVFEDVAHALKTAKEDGFVTVGVFDVHEKNQEKLKMMSDYYIESYSDFEKFWNSINK